MMDPKILLNINKDNEIGNYFLKLASKAQSIKDNPFLRLESDPKLFSKPMKGGIKSKLTLNKALEALKELGKMIDVVGNNQSGDLYDPDILIKSIGKKFHHLPCVLKDKYLIIDFQNLSLPDKSKIGVRVFNVSNGESFNKKDDMVRRSKD